MRAANDDNLRSLLLPQLFDLLQVKVLLEKAVRWDQLLWPQVGEPFQSALVDSLGSSTSDHYRFGSEVDNLLLAFYYFERRWVDREVRHNRELCFEDLSHDLTVAHQVDRHGFMHGHVDPLSCCLVSIVQKMIADVIEQMADHAERHDAFVEFSEQDRYVGREDLLEGRQDILGHPHFLVTLSVLVELLDDRFFCFL